MKKTDKLKRIQYFDVTGELFLQAMLKHYVSNLPNDTELVKVELNPRQDIFQVSLWFPAIALRADSSHFYVIHFLLQSPFESFTRPSGVPTMDYHSCQGRNAGVFPLIQ